MKKELLALFALGLVLLIPLASAGFFDWITGKASTQPENINVPLGNTAPKIVQVFNSSSGTILQGSPFEEGTRTITANFMAYDHDNSTDLNDSSAFARFYMSGETDRTVTCTVAASAGKYRNYTCAVVMWYWDRAGDWYTNFTVGDLSGAIAANDTVNFTYDTLLAFKIDPSTLIWPTLYPGNTSIESDNDPTHLNNTGNNLANVTLNATDLAGHLDSSLAIDANDFKVDKTTACSGTALNTSNYVQILDGPGALKLTRGNLTIGGVNGQQTLYYCLTVVNETLTKQNYTTTTNGAWTIEIKQNAA